MSNAASSQWGSTQSQDRRNGDADDGIESWFDWHPSGQILCQLPRDFSLSFAVQSDAEGFRRILPAGGVEPFLLKTALLGQVILNHTGKIDAETVFACNFYRLFFQQRRWIREIAKRSFSNYSTLRVARRARIDIAEGDVLPDQLGNENGQRSVRWSVNDLIVAGTDRAEQWGIDCPNQSTIICCGLLQAAIQAPLSLDGLSQLEVQSLLRLVLFNNESSPESNEITVEADNAFDLVQKRFTEALEDHIRDDTDDFERWFVEKSDGLIHRIAKKKSHVGIINRNAVREVRLRMLLQAYQSMATCIHAGMHAVRQCVPIEFSDDECTVFQLVYGRQEALGGLPLILIRDRFRVAGLDPVITPLTPRDPAVLLRFLQYYAEMTRKRREADRQYKSAPPRTTSIHSSAGPDIQDGISTGSSAESDVETREEFARIATWIADYSEFKCSCENEGVFQLRDWDALDETLEELTIECTGCHCSKSVPITAELQKYLSDLIAEDQDGC